jgi:hypothetical protein
VRFTLLPALLLIVLFAGCGLQSGGLPGPTDAGLEDRGVGMTDGGGTCICVPNPGAGWTFVAYERDGSLPCPGDFGTHTYAVEELKTGPATCSCTCGAPTNDSTCAITSVAIDLYTNANCAGAADRKITAGGGCLDVAPDYNPNGTITAKGTAQINVMGGSCDPPTGMTSDVPSELHKGASCSLTAALGSGCAEASDVCVPKVPADFAFCVASAQVDAVCPPGFGTKHRVGTSKNDSRACSCSCKPDPICVVEADFDDKNDCSGNQQGSTFNLDGTCRPVTANGMSGHSLDIKIGSETQRCGPAPAPTGTVSLTDEYTVCCP